MTRSILLRAKIPRLTHEALVSRAVASGVTLPTYLRALVEAHLSGDKGLVFRELGSGLAEASDETRRKVAAMGGRAKGRRANGAKRG